MLIQAFLDFGKLKSVMPTFVKCFCKNVDLVALATLHWKQLFNLHLHNVETSNIFETLKNFEIST